MCACIGACILDVRETFCIYAPLACVCVWAIRCALECAYMCASLYVLEVYLVAYGRRVSKCLERKCGVAWPRADSLEEKCGTPLAASAAVQKKKHTSKS